MKLSNKILIGFFGFIFLYLTAAFAELRITGSPNIIDSKNSIAETVDLTAGVTRIIIRDMDNRQVRIIGSDRAQLEIRSFQGDVLKSLKYQVSNNALLISGFKGDENKAVKISVFVPHERLKEISVNSAMVVVEDLELQTLTVSEDQGRVWMSGSTIGKIQTDLSNKSYLDIGSTTLDTVSANIKDSQLYISSPIGLMLGSVKNGSRIQLNEIEEIQLKKDASSNLQMY